MLERPSGIPHESGCYIYRNDRGVVIYVGKARSLAQRLSNYFQRPDALDTKTRTLMSEASSLEWIVTNSEVDALILENELIKTHQPRYNMRLKDDKSFPFLALDRRTPWAQPTITRGKHVKGVRYFGPFAHVGALRRTLDEVLSAYPLRTCSNAKFRLHERQSRPCLLFDLGKCAGPCIGAVTPEAYGEIEEGFERFFEGDVVELRTRLRSRMDDAAATQRYEDAARARDGLVALDRAAEGQRVVLDDRSELDCFAVSIAGTRAAVTMFRVRGGRVVGRNALLLDLAFDETPSMILQRAFAEVYADGTLIPRTILVPDGVEGDDLTASFLTHLRGGPVNVVAPQRGRRRHLMEMVRDDGTEVLRTDSLRREHDHNTRSRALQELGSALGLSRPPYRIECFDMSHLQGTNYVGSMVVFEDGLPKKSEYRRFNVRSVLGNDDAGAMREVVARRLSHWGDAEGGEKFRDADLLIIDGGLPQLGAAQLACEDVGVAGQVELVALAKREELLYRPGSSLPIALERGSESLYLVQRLRDEAHRFAITFHRSKRGKSMVREALEGIPGLGPSRRDALTTHFGSLAAVRAATWDELRLTPGLPENVARTLYDHLHGVPSVRLTKGGAGDE